MGWSKTDTSIKAGDKDNISLPTNFSTTDATYNLEYEQWRRCRNVAYEIIQSKVCGAGSSTATWTIALSGTATAGHGANDTVTVTVTQTAV